MNTGRSILLAPLSLLYSIAIGIRHFLYSIHLLPTHEVDVATVCVGNLAVGGTGKTPHIEWLIRMLSPKYKVAVLSRGYKRKSRGFVLADRKSTAKDIGDECMQIHSKFPDIPVAVCKNRVEGAKRLHQLDPDLDVILLDDAFQYLRLRCGFYILLTTADNIYPADRLLPWGQLRDYAWQSQRANAIIVSKCPDTMTPIDKRIIITRLHTPAYQSLHFSKMIYTPLPKSIDRLPDDTPVVLLTGIAQPEYLCQHLKKRFTNINHLNYPDHYSFTKKDIKQIEAAAEKAKVVFTTEKDFARLQTYELSNDLLRKIHPVEITTQIEDDKNLLDQLNRYIKTCI